MAGVQGDFAAQARTFGHDAVTVQTDARVIWLDLTSLTKGSGYSTGTNLATSGTGVPGALTIDINSVDANGGITGITINTTAASATDNAIASIDGGGGSGATIKIRNTFTNSDQRGCCIYVGVAGNVTAILESGNTVEFVGVNAGTFLPILATRVTSASTATSMLAIY
tara:strand:+ start:576 stop:1079 length:504 start_codon:yes stop_codon:yes gene_type:complete